VFCFDNVYTINYNGGIKISLNLGNSMSKFISVYDITMKYNYSQNVLFANLKTSQKTGRDKVDKETGEILVNPKTGEVIPIPERKYFEWEGRFVGNAFEPAKGLRNGQSIDIVNGWTEKDTFKGKNGQTIEKVYIIISDFVLSDLNFENVT